MRANRINKFLLIAKIHVVETGNRFVLNLFLRHFQAKESNIAICISQHGCKVNRERALTHAWPSSYYQQAA